MPITLEELVNGVRESNAHVLKHADGVSEEQWNWKPYPECKSIRETLIHLLVDDASLKVSLESEGMPDFEGIANALTAASPTDIPGLAAAVQASNEDLCAYLLERYTGADLDTEVNFYGFPTKLWTALTGYPCEMHYHAGQVAFIRMATDPEWNYYAAIYGIG